MEELKIYTSRKKSFFFLLILIALVVAFYFGITNIDIDKGKNES